MSCNTPENLPAMETLLYEHFFHQLVFRPEILSRPQGLLAFLERFSVHSSVGVSRVVVDALTRSYTSDWWTKQIPEWRKQWLHLAFHLDHGQGMILPFIEKCLADEYDPDVLSRLLSIWPPDLQASEGMYHLWEEKTKFGLTKPVGFLEADVRRTGWRALSQLVARAPDVVSIRRWLHHLRQTLRMGEHYSVFSEILDSFPHFGSRGDLSAEWPVWVTELAHHYDRTRYPDDNCLNEKKAIVWKVLWALSTAMSPRMLQPSLGKLLQRYLPEENNSKILRIMCQLPADVRDRYLWVESWWSLRASESVFERECFWKVIIKAVNSGVKLTDTRIKQLLSLLENESHPSVLHKAMHWHLPDMSPDHPVFLRWQAFWEDKRKDEHVSIRACAWQIWLSMLPRQVETDALHDLMVCLRKEPATDVLRVCLRWMADRPSLPEQVYDALARRIRTEKNPDLIFFLAHAMMDWGPLPPVLVAAWRQRLSPGNRPAIREQAWKILLRQPVDLHADIFQYLPGETSPSVLTVMATWRPTGIPLPDRFWEEWAGKIMRPKFSHDRLGLIKILAQTWFDWNPHHTGELMAMWNFWVKLYDFSKSLPPHSVIQVSYTHAIAEAIAVLRNSPFFTVAPPPELAGLADELGHTRQTLRYLSQLYSSLRQSATPPVTPAWWMHQAATMVRFLNSSSPEVVLNVVAELEQIWQHLPASAISSPPGWKNLLMAVSKIMATPKRHAWEFWMTLLQVSWRYVSSGSLPEWWQTTAEIAAEIARRSEDDLLPGELLSLIRQKCMVEHLSSSMQTVGPCADQTTWLRLFRYLRMRLWLPDDEPLWSSARNMVLSVVQKMGENIFSCSPSDPADLLFPVSSDDRASFFKGMAENWPVTANIPAVGSVDRSRMSGQVAHPDYG